MTHKTTLTRRSGRRTSDHEVLLERAPEDYRIGDSFDITIEGRTVPVHVEIPIGDNNRQLYVA
jgi:hypothetical protein